MNMPSLSRSPRRRPTRHAFTLVELLLVLVILGTLAAIVLPRFSGTTERARRTQAQTQIATFGTALDAFEVDVGRYPSGRSGLLDLIQQPREGVGWHGPYPKNETSIPKDPWGNDYIYECPGKHNPNGYDLSSMGVDGRAGGDDDISNWQQANPKE
jgi:general secretion pathway protein G